MEPGRRRCSIVLTGLITGMAGATITTITGITGGTTASDAGPYWAG